MRGCQRADAGKIARKRLFWPGFLGIRTQSFRRYDASHNLRFQAGPLLIAVHGYRSASIKRRTSPNDSHVCMAFVVVFAGISSDDASSHIDEAATKAVVVKTGTLIFVSDFVNAIVHKI